MYWFLGLTRTLSLYFVCSLLFFEFFIYILFGCFRILAVSGVHFSIFGCWVGQNFAQESGFFGILKF